MELRKPPTTKNAKQVGCRSRAVFYVTHHDWTAPRRRRGDWVQFVRSWQPIGPPWSRLDQLTAFIHLVCSLLVRRSCRSCRCELCFLVSRYAVASTNQWPVIWHVAMLDQIWRLSATVWGLATSFLTNETFLTGSIHLKALKPYSLVHSPCTDQPSFPVCRTTKLERPAVPEDDTCTVRLLGHWFGDWWRWMSTQNCPFKRACGNSFDPQVGDRMPMTLWQWRYATWRHSILRHLSNRPKSGKAVAVPWRQHHQHCHYHYC